MAEEVRLEAPLTREGNESLKTGDVVLLCDEYVSGPDGFFL